MRNSLSKSTDGAYDLIVQAESAKEGKLTFSLKFSFTREVGEGQSDTLRLVLEQYVVTPVEKWTLIGVPAKEQGSNGNVFILALIVQKTGE